MVRLGDVLLWVNQSQYEREVRIEGVSVSEATIFSEAAMKNEDEVWMKRVVDQNRIVVPGRSFGSMTCIFPDVD
jgi:hypothetical protein